jgi:aspartate ammonia-lyase
MSDHRADQAFHKSIHTVDFAGGSTRTETDNLGTKQIPAGAYWGLNVSRALDNFAISGRLISTYPDLIFGYACVKQAAACANANIADLVVASGLLTREQVTEMLSPGHLTALAESGPREQTRKAS